MANPGEGQSGVHHMHSAIGKPTYATLLVKFGLIDRNAIGSNKLDGSCLSIRVCSYLQQRKYTGDLIC